MDLPSIVQKSSSDEVLAIGCIGTKANLRGRLHEFVLGVHSL